MPYNQTGRTGMFVSEIGRMPSRQGDGRPPAPFNATTRS